MVEFHLLIHPISSTTGHKLLYHSVPNPEPKKTTQHHGYRGLGCIVYVQWGQTDIDLDGNEHLGQSAERPNGAPRQAPLVNPILSVT